MGPLELTTILQSITAYRDQIHDMWKTLLAILDNRDKVALSQYILAFLEGQGLRTDQLSSYPNVLYGEMRYYEAAPTLLCYQSYDPDFSATLQARAIAASLLSLITYKTICASRTDIPPFTLKWLLGQKNAAQQLQQRIEEPPMHCQADACLWYEPLTAERTIQGDPNHLVLATGTKGYLSVELQVQTAHSPIHSSNGSIAPNAAWRLLWALNSLKDRREEILIGGFYDTMTPLEDDAFQQLADLPDTAVAQAAHWGIAELLMGLQGKQMHYAHVLTPTCTINKLSSGEDFTTPSNHSIPATARAAIDFYLVPGQDPADIFAKLERHLRTHGFADIHVTLRYAGSPVYTPTHHSFVQQVIQSAERVYKQAPTIVPILPEHIPIRSIIPSPTQPVVIIPLYGPELHKHANSEEQALHNSIAHLTSIMTSYTQ